MDFIQQPFITFTLMMMSTKDLISGHKLWQAIENINSMDLRLYSFNQIFKEIISSICREKIFGYRQLSREKSIKNKPIGY